MAALLLVLVLGDTLADARALCEEQGVAAFEEVFALAVAEQDHRKRHEILRVLATLGPEAVPLVVAKTQLQPPPPRARECAFMTLQLLAARDDTIQVVVPLLVHPDSAVRRVARDGLKRESAIPALLAALRQGDAKLRNELRAVLRAQGEALRPHLARLGDVEDADFRVQLVPLLAAAGPLETLVAWTRDPDAIVRLQVVTELSRHKDAPKVVVPALVGAFADTEPRVRATAARGLANFKAQAQGFVEALGALVDDANDGVAVGALATLAVLGAPGLPFLERELAADESRRRLRLVQALAEADAEVRPLLERAARDAAPAVRAAAVRALGRWPAAVAAIERALGDGDVDVQAAALAALEQLGPKAAPAAEAVAKLVHTKRLQGFVFDTLIAMGPDALAAFLDVARRVPPDAAMNALRRRGGKTMVPALAAILGTDPEPARRRTAAWALGQFGARSAPAVPALVRALDDKNRFVVVQAVWALGQVGKDAQAAVPALKTKLKDPELRALAQQALDAIEGAAR